MHRKGEGCPPLLRTPAAKHPPPQAQHLQACLAPGDSTPGSAGEEGPGGEARSRPHPGNAGLGGMGRWKSVDTVPPPWKQGKRQWLSVTGPDPSPLVKHCMLGGWGSFQGETFLSCSPRIWNPREGGSALSHFHDWGRGEDAHKDRGKMCQGQTRPLTGRSISARQGAEGWAQDRGLGPGQKPGQGGQDGSRTHPAQDPCLGLPPPSCPRVAARRSRLQSALSPALPGICQSHLIPSPSLSLCQDSADPVEPAGSWVRGGSEVEGR